MDNNDFIFALLSGSYAVLCFYVGRIIWWPEGSLRTALLSFRQNLYWNLYGLAISVGPVIESLHNINIDSSDVLVYCLGSYWAYYCLYGPGLKNNNFGSDLSSFVGGLFVLSFPAQVAFASFGFLDTFELSPPIGTDHFTSGVICLAPVICVGISLNIYSKTVIVRR